MGIFSIELGQIRVQETVLELEATKKNCKIFYLRVVWWGNSVKISRDLSSQIRNHDKLLENVLGQDVGVARFLDVVRGHVDVVRSQVKVRGGDGSHAPLGLAGEGVGLVVARRRGDDLVAVLVDRSRRRRRQLRLLLRLLLDFCDLLPLRARSRDLHAEDDVSDFGLGQAGHVDVVLLSVIVLLSIFLDLLQAFCNPL